MTTPAPKPIVKVMSRKRVGHEYNNYIYKVLKQVHPDTSMTTSARMMLNALLMSLTKKLVQTSCELDKKHVTLSSRNIQTAVRLTFPGELAKHAVSEGTKAVTKYTSSKV